MQGRLNSFQRTMLRWSDLYPYNAVHVARLAQPADPRRIEQAIHSTLQRRGLACIEIDRRSRTFRYTGGDRGCPVEYPPPGSDPQHELAGIIERQLNTPFVSSGPFCPIRFFVAPADDGFWLGLVYFHAIADAVSIVYLLREVVDACSGGNTAGEREPPNLYPPCFDNLLRHQPVVLARKLMRHPAEIHSARRSIRPPYADPNDMALGFRFVTLAPGQLTGLLRTSKDWGVTLNDLFLALLLKSLSPLAAGRMKERRRKLSVGSIVNLRGDHGLEGDGEFGLFLGSFVVSREVPPDSDLKALAVSVCRRTRRIKQLRLPLGLPVELAISRLAQRFLPLEGRRKFYQKNRPLWGGITNMNLNAIRSRPGEVPPADYLRAVATGPATPLVLSVTTTGDRAHIGISYRTTVFGAAEIEEFQARFAGEMADHAMSS